jgi:protein gp37
MDPLHWKKPRKIFLGSMTDLFHPLVPFGLLDQIFAIVALCQQHTFQILTKRPERMKEYFDTSTNNPMADISIWANSISEGQYSVMGNKLPLPNLWIGVTAENQACADKRIPILLQIPAAVRFVSIEPMLGLVDLNKYNLIREDWKKWMGSTIETYLDWVICGPENGKIKRECNIDWEIDLYRQCKETNTAFYCKNDIGLPKEFPTWANNDY